MSNLLRQRAEEGRGKALPEGVRPTALRFVPSERSVVSFNNGEEATSACFTVP